MAWSGGTYTKGNNATGGWVGDASLGIGIEAGRHDTQDNDFATGINQCLNKDGSNAATGNLNIGTYRVTNIGAATARTDAAQAAQVQDGSFIWLGTTGGTATAQTASATPAIAAYATGQKFRMKVGASLGSTGATRTAHTLNINSLGTKNLVNQDGTNPTAGTWIAGNIIEAVYDGTNFVIVNDAGDWQTWTPTVSLSSGSVTNVVSTLTKYRKYGKTVNLVFNVAFDTSSGSPYLEITGLPVQLANSGVAANTWVGSTYVAATDSLTIVYNNSASNIAVLRNVTATSWGTFTGSSAKFNIQYEAL